ncbi:hypothetical protein AYL99_00607 [Fonsecaea erecta]|uniref:F-box domain-containing protein n=1 Tax=Fonsecaea erecta TaxID=1367422 RepID=A0A179A078_9EURO|nr:hypothetical protein AYL99_00607 [Fonsecaea erecta]OAP64635.1 hypothetical protein AYL99_00607 [Fonsecaea erecta]
MDEPSRLAAPWARLPPEIKANIMGRLARMDLKSCRLLDKCTNLAATRALFRTLCLSPSLNSVKRLSKVAARPNLASQVHTLHIYRHYLKLVSFDECIRTGHLAEHLRRLHPLDAASHALELLEAYKGEVEAQLHFAVQGPPLLSDSLKKFPHLQCFVHCGMTNPTENGDYLLDEDSDLLRRTGIRTLEGRTHYLMMHSTLQKCRGLKPVSIDLSSFYWWEFYNCMEIPHAKALFERVIHFKLTFEVKSFDRGSCPLKPTNAHWRKGLTKYLGQLAEYLPAAEHVWLGFDELVVGQQRRQSVRSYALTKMTSLLLRPPAPENAWSRLNSLTLENIAVEVKDLSNFIARHSELLRSLTIINIHLRETDRISGGILSSMMKLISFLNRETRLDHFALIGTFLGPDGDTLTCCPKGKGSILHDLNEYVCHRGEFPFCSPKIFLQDVDTYWPSATVAGNKVTIPGPRHCRVEIILGSDDSWHIEGPERPAPPMWFFGRQQ